MAVSKAGEIARVVRIESEQVHVEAGGREKLLPLRTATFDVAQARPMEISSGDRLLVRANYRRDGLLNGDLITVRAIRDGIITSNDGRITDTRRVRQLTHGDAITSHKSQSKTADHVIVAAERPVDLLGPHP